VAIIQKKTIHSLGNVV